MLKYWEYQHELEQKLLESIKELFGENSSVVAEDLYFINTNPKLYSTIYESIHKDWYHQLPEELSNTITKEEIENIRAIKQHMQSDLYVTEHFNLIHFLIRTTDYLFIKHPNHERRHYILRLLEPEFFNQQVLLHALIAELVKNKYPTKNWYKKFSTAINL